MGGTATFWFKSEWHDAPKDEASELYSELDSERREIRRVERFVDGSLGWTNRVQPSARTSLSWERLPELDEINVQEQFSAVAIDPAEFEAICTAARSAT